MKSAYKKAEWSRVTAGGAVQIQKAVTGYFSTMKLVHFNFVVAAPTFADAAGSDLATVAKANSSNCLLFK